MASATVRAVATASGVGTDYTFSLPAGTQATDSVFVVLAHETGSHATGGFPAPGWTSATDAVLSQAGGTIRVYERGLSAGAGPWTGTLTSAQSWVTVAIAVIPSVTPLATPPVVELAAAPTSGTSNTSGTCTAITPISSDDLLLYVMAAARGTTFTPPGGVTEIADARAGNTTTSRSLWVGSRSLTGQAGVAQTAVTVGIDNPFSFSVIGSTGITLAVRSAPPVATFDGPRLTDWVVETPEAITELADPDYPGGYFFRLRTAETTGTYITENPRSQMGTPRIVFPGTVRWFEFDIRFASDFPVIPRYGRVMFMQIYGPPYLQSPVIAFRVTDDQMQLRYNGGYATNSNAAATTVWSRAVRRGAWRNFRLGVGLEGSQNGWIEVHLDGQQQTFATGRRRLRIQTLDTDQIYGVNWVLNNYRNANELAPDAVTQIDFRRATMRDVAPVAIQVGSPSYLKAA